jgi:hypothetical protein
MAATIRPTVLKPTTISEPIFLSKDEHRWLIFSA